VKKVPKTVSVAGQSWKVIVKAEGSVPDDYGETDWNTRTIYLYTAPHKKHGQNMQATFFHELLHAALASTGVDNILGGDREEEAIVTALENALWPLIESGLLR
jgi:hypothetical protein